MHKQFRKISTMFLIGFFRGDHLTCADRVIMFKSSEENDFLTPNGLRDLCVKLDGLRHRERIHKTDRSAFCHTVVKYDREFIYAMLCVISVKNADLDQAIKTFFDSTVESAFRR